MTVRVWVAEGSGQKRWTNGGGGGGPPAGTPPKEKPTKTEKR